MLARRDGDAFLAKVMLVAFVAAVGLLTWRLSDVFVLMFGALIVSTALRSVSSRLERHVRLPGNWAVAGAVLLLVGAAVVAFWFVGARIADQLDRVREQLPAALDAATSWLSSHPLGPYVLGAWQRAKDGGVPWGQLASAAGLTIGAIGSAGLMLVLGVYLAADPTLYRDGMVRLVPVAHRDRVRQALRTSGEALSRWLLGQCISMLFVGVATAAGLAVLGMPLALSLGLIAGILAFVPFFGPIAAGVLAVLLASMEGVTQAIYVGCLCVAIQQIEGNLLMPFVQRWAVSLPPVLGLVSVVIFGLLFGMPGVLLATPLMVVVVTLTRDLYVEGALEGSPAGPA